MTNLQESLPKELLRTNRSGAYSCSTIVDCNTRKYHGLLVVPVPELDDENHVLLSSLDVLLEKEECYAFLPYQIKNNTLYLSFYH
jgi:glycogen debranching enzyme